MTDSLKFGPEWLRNLAGDGCNSGGGGASLTTPRYQLAEHRYGREEMLALFDRNYKPPEPLTSFSGLYVPKAQLPLALIQMTEEETRLWNGGVSVSTGRGRGGSVDRGGRSRSGRTYRGAGFDDLGDSPRNESQPFPARTRAFDRPPADRSWSERNGAVDSVEWNGSTSPRKELSRGASGGSLMESNWRRHRGGGDDEDGWRMNSRENRGLGKASWRDADKDRAEGDDDKRGERWDHKGANRAFDPHPPPLRRNRSNHHDNHDNLPEWATENPSESGGSFDASGAFHGMYSDDDEDHPGDKSNQERKRGSRVRRVSEGNAPHSKNGVKASPSGGNIRSTKAERSLNGERPKSLHSSESKDQYTSAEKESRRSLSPISSPPVPSSPASKKSRATTNDAGSGGGSKTTASVTESKKKEKTSKQEKQQKEQAQTNASKAKSKVESPKKVSEPKTKAENQPSAFSEVPDDADPERQASNMIEMAKREQEIYRRLQEVFQMKQDLQQQSPRQQKQLLHQSSQPVPTSADSSIIEGPTEDKQRSTEADHLNRMEEEVAKLIDGTGLGDQKPPMSVPPPGSAATSSVVVNQGVIDPAVATVMQSTTIVQEKWYYRDPQGEVQGPFLANEMAEWHKQGYFAPNLLVRRTCDERYTTLGDLVNLCGTVPFKPGTNFPPLKLTDTILPSMPSALPTGLPVTSALPKPANQLDPLMLYQLEQYRMLQNQHMFLKQLRVNAINKLSQSEQWSNLTPVEQNQLVLQYVRSIDPELADLPPLQPPVIPSTFIPTIPPPAPPSNSVLQLFPQLHQTAKPQAEAQHVAAQNSHPVSTQSMQSSPIDPIQQLMQQMSGMRNLPPMPQAPIAPSPPQPQPQSQLQDDNPIKQWMRQFSVQAQQQRPQPQPQPPVESVWQQPVLNPNTFNRVQDWVSQVRGVHPMQPGQMPGGKSLLDFYKEKMMTEQQILEEQRQKEMMEEEQRKLKEIELQRLQQARAKQEAEVEQQRKQDELRMKQERAKRQQEEELARLKAEEAAKREEAERKKREEEKKRKEEEKRRQEEEQRKQEEKRRKEEERKREEKRKQDEEANKKKQEEEKRKREELKRQEEKLRKEEEKRKKLEEEQRKQEEERLRKEEEARKKAEAEEQARKAEQRRREAEALRKLQERSKAPWAQAPPAPPPTAQASLAEIQRLEREKKAEELRLQQLLQQQQLAQQKAAEAAQEALADSAKRLQFKWAEKTAPVNNVNRVQSLAQIQQEEQERIAKLKQQEKERQEKEKASHKEPTVTLQNVSIWGAASQSLTWSSTSNSGNQMYGSGGGGFWDEPAPKVNTPAPKATTPKAAQKQQPTVVKSPAQQQQHQQQQQQQQQQLQQQQNNKAAKSKNKKDEELVKKLFEQNTAKTDDFTQWCNKALTGLQVSVDIPTFIGFLRDIEAAYEVKEYVRMYLGDGKQCSEFAKQFLEKRSKWRSSQRPQTQADDLCKPAPAINPNTSTEFQEVKSKSKKPKKGKMFKVDSKMLGFSVMSAPDRINVGDRDYADGV